MRCSKLHATSGFTILELMVVVVVILILLGMGWPTHPRGPGERQLTSTSLATAQAVLDEYMLKTSQPAPASTAALYTAIVSPPGIDSLRKQLAGLPPQLIGAGTIVDGWGAALVLNPTGAAGAGLPLRPAPYFASPGPDGAIGTPSDNLYSFNNTGAP